MASPQDKLIQDALPSYSAEQQETVRDLYKQISEFTKTDPATAQDVAAINNQQDKLNEEIANLYSSLNPSLPPREALQAARMQRAMILKPLEPGAVFPFEDAVTYLNMLLEDARSNVREVDSLKAKVEQMQKQVQEIQETWAKANRLKESLGKMKQEGDQICANRDAMKKELEAVDKECEQLEDRIYKARNPDAAQKGRLMECEEMMECQIADEPIICGQSAASAASSELKKVERKIKEEKKRAEAADREMTELASKKERSLTRLKGLRLDYVKAIFEMNNPSNSGNIDRSALKQVLSTIQGNASEVDAIVDAFNPNGEQIQFSAFVDWLGERAIWTQM